MTEKHEYKRNVGLLDATMFVAGAMIGSGIFIVSADMVRHVGSAGWLILLWCITGAITVIGALSYGELSGMFPKAGGQYTYIREAYGRRAGFLYGWSFFSVIQTGTIAAVGVAFSKFAAYLFPVMGEDHLLFSLGGTSVSAAQGISILLIIFLTFVNTKGVYHGKVIQTVVTLAKIGSLIGLIVFGVIFGAKGAIWHDNWQEVFHFRKLTPLGYEDYIGLGAMGAFAAAMVGSLFSSDSWHNIAFIAGEVKRPERNIGLSLVLGTIIVTVLYALVNLVYLSALPLKEIAFAQNDRIAIDASFQLFGGTGTKIMAALIMISTFGCVNGLIITGARVYHTMAEDGLFFKKTAQLNCHGVPEHGLWIQCIWASLLCLSGHYGDLLDYVIFVVLLFYMLTILGIFRLRRTRPDVHRPYKAFGYPLLPILYIVIASLISVSLLIYKPKYTWPGLIIVLLGVPIYQYLNRDRNPDTIK
ncbi:MULTISPECIES: APC family permease [Chitinophagaceae]